MNIALWILQVLLALGFLLAGLPKLTQPIAALAKRLTWASDIPAWQVRGIGLAEVLGALGLILPGATGIAPALTVVAAIGLAIVMLSAAVFHLARHEGSHVPSVLVLALLALLVVVGRGALAPLA